MRCKRVCLVINPRAGHNVAKITDLIAVFAAAGWKTDIALKAYPGQAMQLAARAARQNYDLIVAYGGDGTINQVVNGVINARGRSIVGVIPGGTANEWAVEIGLPLDPVHAALTLVNSDARTIDLGHIQVEGLTFPLSTRPESDQQLAPPKGKKVRKKQAKAAAKGKPRFLLMAGPRVYDDNLFKKSPGNGEAHAVPQEQKDRRTARHNDHFVEGQQEAPELIKALLEAGLKMTVAGVAPNPDKKDAYIIAGTLQNQKTGDAVPVAVPVDNSVVVTNRAGKRVSAAAVQKLQEGTVVVIEGKKSRRGVIRATHIVI
ncbi:MAG: diacylglycerol/lipid kinase family protein [Ktedonobacteraceae bacterium]